MSNQRPQTKFNPQNLGVFKEIALRAKLVMRLISDPRVPPLIKIMPLAAVVYWIVPFDLMPGIPLDDAAVVWLAYTLFLEMCPQDVVQEHMNQLRLEAQRAEEMRQTGQNGPSAQQAPRSNQENVVDAEFRDVTGSQRSQRNSYRNGPQNP